MSDRTSDSVGYRRPPTHSQFKPGKSGNPRGRPKRPALGYDDFLREELLAAVSIQTNGKRQKLRKYEVILKQIVKRAMEGEFRFVRFMTETPAFRAVLESPGRPLLNSAQQKFIDEVYREAKELNARRRAQDEMASKDRDASF